MDPKTDLVYVFLSNRVYNTRANNLLGQMNIRGKVQDAIYKALEEEQKQKMVKGANALAPSTSFWSSSRFSKLSPFSFLSHSDRWLFKRSQEKIVAEATIKSISQF